MAKKPVRRSNPRKADNTVGYLVLAIASALVLAVVTYGMLRHGFGPSALQGMGMDKTVHQQWQSDFNGFHAVFQTEGDTFQILAVQKGGKRYFSRGRYGLEGNMIKLTPDDTLGEPQVENPAQKFTKLTYGTYRVELQRSGGDLVWRSAPVDPQRAAVDPRHPLIQYSGAKTITWTLKN
ncbi:MAG: hypothetical protein JWO78_791 [Micavibrio sp.]|nr:hypothetical protein [Micavibrio sp.]